MKQYAIIGIAVKDRSSAGEKVNQVLSEYGDYIIGRMGIRKVEEDVSVIALIVEGHTDTIGAITGKLGSIENVSVRSGLLKNKF
ncbi:MAG: iron-only hydrogenase system regulator [Calditrichia bacterium]